MRGPVVNVVVLVVCGLVRWANCQPIDILQSPNPDSLGRFGWKVSWIGDSNGDSYCDLLVDAREHIEPNGTGRAYVCDGQDGHVLFSVASGPGGTFEFEGISAAGGTGDLDNDGCTEIAVSGSYLNNSPGDPPWGYSYLQILNGESGQTLWRVYYARAEEAGPMDDLNGDGCADLLASEYVRSGSDGSVLVDLDSPNPESSSFFGGAASGIGDLDGDSFRDCLIGAKREDGGAPDAGRAYLFSGVSGQLLFTLISSYPDTNGYFGSSVARVGDLNSDGYEEALVGAPQEDGGAGDAGRAYVFGGDDGGLLQTVLSPAPEDSGRFGWCLASIGDVSGDGLDDLLIGAPCEDGGAVDAGRAYVFSGTGALLATLESPNPEANGNFGYSLDGIGDTNGDGIPEFAIGAPYEDGGAVDAGRVYVYSGSTVPVELTGFSVVAHDGEVVLTWSTLSESQTFGFHLYRSASQTRDYTRITASIIPGAGTTAERHDYSYTDTAVQPGTYFYKLADVDFGGNETLHGPVNATVLPITFTLLGVHPNPFNESTTIRLDLPQPVHYRLTLHNMAGERVRTLAGGGLDAGLQELSWDGRDDASKLVAPGTYTCRVESGARMQTVKVVVTR